MTATRVAEIEGVGGARRLRRLTSREVEVAWRVHQGKSTKAIARELGIRYRTVESHIWNACEKLGIHGRRQLGLALYVERHEKRFRRAVGKPAPKKVDAPEDRQPTKREREIARLIYDGHTYPEIAAIFNGSVSTVKQHVENMARKVGGSGPRQLRLIRWWAEHGRNHAGRNGDG